MTGRGLKCKYLFNPIKKILQKYSCKVINPENETEFEERSAFLGASILSQLQTIQPLFITLKQYYEYGIDLINSTYP